MIDALRLFTIPSLQPWLDHPHGKTLKRGESVVVPRVPDVSHWSMAIADVGSGSCKNALRYSMTRGDHEVEPAQIPRPDSSRKERQKISIVAAKGRVFVAPRKRAAAGVGCRAKI